MTVLALVEVIERALEDHAEHVGWDTSGSRVVLTAEAGKQALRITCEELAPDESEPAV